jgi:hypothetical protein
MEIEIRGLSALSLLLGTLPARACPICATETGAQVRDQIFNDGFVANLGATILPFALISLAIAVPACWGSSRSRAETREKL